VAIATKRTDPTKCQHERLLRRLVSIFCSPEDPVARPVDPGRLAFHEDPESRWIPGHKSLGQRAIGLVYC
jgi:hypothetical protein